MAVRPVDLQQILVKLPDVGRDAATQQQQPATAQQLLANEEAKRNQERAETVQQFDQTGMAAVDERQGSERHGSGEDDEREQAETNDGLDGEAAATARAAQARLGRHIDLQA